ncbi:hypothetical protein K402DRAFT_250842 [Aulographum hederae CBS 113979]|uniref:Uncharacterized protein n=1 Tax=Aulographum hederae CBS 113979 TaxID=1176131 RepID=A0A6G1GJX0_9PEZI|nr:hypothetical protein K402DRAFT_250842 [Aulographum hederae CBS 113979]
MRKCREMDGGRSDPRLPLSLDSWAVLTMALISVSTQRAQRLVQCLEVDCTAGGEELRRRWWWWCRQSGCAWRWGCGWREGGRRRRSTVQDCRWLWLRGWRRVGGFGGTWGLSRLHGRCG